MRLTVLGAATPYPQPGNPCSGYLVQSDDTSIWVDAGTGTLAELQRHIRLDDLDAIWISHLHADHTADLLAAYYALRFSEFAPKHPLPLFGPAQLMKRLQGFLGSDSAEKLPTVFDFTAMTRSGGGTVGDLAITWQKVDHGVPAFGLRVEGTDATLAYSGDTTRCDAVVTLATGAHALLCEVGARGHEGSAQAVHCTPKEAAEMAAEAGVERLIVTHVGDGMSPELAAARAGAGFTGPVDIARPGEVYVLSGR